LKETRYKISEADRKNVDKMFAAFDSDRSGYLEVSELRLFIEELAKL
jgi:Ca2+-binding EF-hand superfamily protein